MKKFILPILALLLLAGFKNYTNRTVTGTIVSDADGTPLAGVRVGVKESPSAFTTTSSSGTFKLTVSEKAKTLVISYVGFKTAVVNIPESNTIKVRLKADTTMLNEVIVQGAYGAKMTQAYAAAEARQNQYKAMTLRSANIQQYPGNTESYAGINENAFHKALTDPLSTFSIDVDAASYSNVRRFINSGTIPPKDAVRIEEMINYFDYNYSQPTGDDPVNIITEAGPAPWNPNHQLVHIGLKAKTIATEDLPASNLVFLIDVSGSMGQPNKLPLLVSSLKLLTDQLREQDHVAIVVYAGNAGVVLPPTPGNKKSVIKTALQNLGAGGSTAGGRGIMLAYKIARENFIAGGNNRVILATDGDFNVGASSDREMEALIEKERKSNIFLTVLGYGMGNYKDSKMEVLADKGNGNYAYIDNISEARKVLVKEFGGTIFTVAKDVKLQIEFNPAKVAAYRLIGYENRLLNKEDFNNDEKDAGEIGAGHTVTALYEIIPVGVKSSFIGSVDELKYQVPVTPKPLSNELLTVKLRYKKPDGDKSILLSKPVTGPLTQLGSTSNNFRFAAAVAEFGMLLRDSEFKQNAGFDNVIELAENALGSDKEGYRHEFLTLVKAAKLLAVDLLTFKDKKIMNEKN